MKKTAGGEVRAAMDTAAKMRLVSGWLHDNKAEAIMALDVSGLCGVAEGMVLASAHSGRHAQGLADNLLKSASEAGVEFLGMEGYQGGTWILLDFNDVLVHIFKPEIRSFYNLEGLWPEAESLDLKLDES